MLKPVILFTTVISTIGTLQLFDEVNTDHPWAARRTATLTLSLYIYNLSSIHADLGYAATVSWVIVILVGILSWLQFLVREGALG